MTGVAHQTKCTKGRVHCGGSSSDKVHKIAIHELKRLVIPAILIFNDGVHYFWRVPCAKEFKAKKIPLIPCLGCRSLMQENQGLNRRMVLLWKFVSPSQV